MLNFIQLYKLERQIRPVVINYTSWNEPSKVTWLISTTRWSCSCWMIISHTAVFPDAAPPATPNQPKKSSRNISDQDYSAKRFSQVKKVNWPITKGCLWISPDAETVSLTAFCSNPFTCPFTWRPEKMNLGGGLYHVNNGVRTHHRRGFWTMKAGKPYKIKVSDLKYLNLCHNRTYANKRESYTTTQLGLTLIFRTLKTRFPRCVCK